MSATQNLERRGSVTYASYSYPLWRRYLLRNDTAIILLLVVALIGSFAFVPHFNNPNTLYYLFRDLGPILLIALPMTLVIITGEIDISVASTAALAGVCFGLLHVDLGMPVPAAAALAILLGALCGLLNGVLVARVGLPSIAVTIGTMALFRGIASGLLGTESRTDFPEFWTDLAKQRIFEGLPYPMILIPFVILAAGFILLLHFSPFGRGVFELGLSEESARFTGTDVARTKIAVFVLTGATAAFAGIYLALVTSVARAENAMSLELQVIAAVLLGGVSIFGGRGALPGVIAGAVLIGVIQRAMYLSGMTVDIVNIVIGVLLIATVVASALLAKGRSFFGGLRAQAPREALAE
jgi:rhamnose transport system permease protein